VDVRAEQPREHLVKYVLRLGPVANERTAIREQQQAVRSYSRATSSRFSVDARA
jgi:hypothetical protein